MALNLNSLKLNKLKLKDSTVYYAALIEQLFSHLPSALFANLILSFLLVFVLWSEISHQKLCIWIIAIWVISFGRFAQYLFRPKVNFSVRRWSCFFSIGIILTGIAWGATGIFLFAENSFPHQVFVAFVLGGLAAGATTSVAGLQWVFRIFVCLLMVPISVRFFSIGGQIYFAMGTMLVIYGVMCCVMSAYVHKMLLAAIHLSQENKQEIEERKKAEAELMDYKNQLEETVKKRTVELEKEIKIRKQVETDLLKINDRYHQITSNLPGLVYQFLRRADGTFLMPYISDGVQSIFGVTAEEVVQNAHSILKFVHPDDYHEFEHSIEISKKELSPYNHDFRALVNGEEIWVNAKSRPKRLANGDTLWDGILFNITAHKRMEEEKTYLETQLRQTHKIEAIGVLAGGIAHDFNNLLTAILGNINLAFFDSQLSVKTKKLLSEAEKASLRAKDLTSQLLTFAKGGAPIKQTSSLEDVIIDSADFVLQGDSVACQYLIPNDLWLVDVDKGQISQVIQNIVLNSSHAMHEGGTIKIRCENFKYEESGLLPLNPDKKYVKISIQDSGIGIPANIVEKIFDPYFSTKDKGSGLGLAITQSIIKKHNGCITVESTPGGGSIFTIYLPASDKLSENTDITPFETDGQQANPSTIMIMDDEEMVCSMTKEMLNILGHEVYITKDGEEAVNLYSESLNKGKPFDVVIMDLTIPGGMGGKEAAQKTLEINPKAKIIVSSGYSNDHVMANYEEYGFCSAIVKPYQFKELSQIINHILN